MRHLLSIVLITFCLGCASNHRSDFDFKLREVELGMSKMQVAAIFSQAVPRGAKKYPNGTVEVLEVRHEYYAPFAPRADPWSGYVTDTPTWFYFYNGKLVQYGAANDWPTEPDKIIEIRQR